MLLTLSIFSRRDVFNNCNIFLTFPRKQDWTFHANCPLKNINLSSDEFAYRVGKVTSLLYHCTPDNGPQ